MRLLESTRLYAALRTLTSTDDARFVFLVADEARLEASGLAECFGVTRPEAIPPARLVGERFGCLVRETDGRRSARLDAGVGGGGAAGGLGVFIKQYDAGSGRSGKIARRAAPARIEAERLVQLGRLGLPVPELLFACWSRSGGRGPGATVQVVIEGRGLDEVFAEASEAARARCVEKALLPIVVRLHECGYFHRDLYLGHFLGEVQADHQIRVHGLVDVARAVRSAGFLGRLRVKDLAALLVSLDPWVSRRVLFRAYIEYAACLELPARWTGRGGRRRLLRAVMRRAARMLRHRPRFDPALRSRDAAAPTATLGA